MQNTYLTYVTIMDFCFIFQKFILLFRYKWYIKHFYIHNIYTFFQVK